MEELESLLASVKAWAGRLLESLGLCHAERDALKIDNEALKVERESLLQRLAEAQKPSEALRIELANTQADLALERARFVPLEPPDGEPARFDMTAVLTWMTEFRALAETIKLDIHSRSDGLSASQNEIAGKLSEVIDEVKSILGLGVKDIDKVSSELQGAWVSSANELQKVVSTSAKDMSRTANEISTMIADVRSSLAALSSLTPAISELKAALSVANSRPSTELGSFVTNVNDFMVYVKAKLNRLPF